MAPSLSLPPAVVNLAPFVGTSRSRLQSLYSAFDPQRHSNPASYHANVDWWRRTLEAFASSTGSLSLRAGSSLLQSLHIPGVGKPLSLGAVISDLQQTRAFISRAEFLADTRSVYDKASLPSLIAATIIGRPLWWALENLGVVGEEGFLYSTSVKGTQWHGDYVILSLVEKAADKVDELQRQRDTGHAGDSLYTRDNFRRLFASALKSTATADQDFTMKEEDAQVLLRYLERDRRILVVAGEVIKFVSPNTPQEECIVTAIDRGIIELKTAVENMHVQVEAIQRRMNECTKRASSALTNKHKDVALARLRSRKQLEGLLRQRLGSLETLEATLIRVEAAAGDIEIMKAYEQSTATLRTILAHPSLERAHVDETMEALAEANADAREIDDAISAGADVALGTSEVYSVDDSELEAELNALVEEQRIETSRIDLNKEREPMKAVEIGIAEQRYAEPQAERVPIPV